MTDQPKHIRITTSEFNDIMDILQYWTTSFREGCSEKDRLWLQRIVNMVGEIRSRPLSDHDTEIRMKERERVLDMVMGTISNLNLPCNMNPYDTVACIRGEIESLRGEP